MKWHLLWPVVCLMLFVFSTNSAVLHVDPNGTNAMLPYSNWSIAATNIQDAIDAASNGDLVLVTNGVYNAGVRTIGSYGGSRIAITKPIEVASVNGPTVTIIDSFGQVAV